MNLQGLIAVRVTGPSASPPSPKVLELVEEAAARKAPTERAITAFARWYTPRWWGRRPGRPVAPPPAAGRTFADWLYRALVLLVIRAPAPWWSPCRSDYFGGIGGASRAGILVKGGNYLDALAQAGHPRLGQDRDADAGPVHE